MAKELLIDLLNNRISLDSFCEWISGEGNKDISNSLNRTDFVLYTLNYVQEASSKFIATPLSTSAKEKGRSRIERKNEDLHRKLPENIINPSENEAEFNNRAPFQTINRMVPPNTAKQPYSRFMNHGSDSRKEILNCSSPYTPRTISSSTPVHNRSRKNSGRDQFNTSPQSASSSIHSEHNFKQTPLSNKSSQKKNNSSGSSQGFSPQSNSSTFSPTSPQYIDLFPDLGSRRRPKVPPSASLADFIICKPNPKKDRRRIKPTQLTTSPNKNISNDYNHANKGFGEVNRPFVAINPILQPQLEVKEKSNFEKERTILKQKRSDLFCTAQPNESLLCNSPGDLSDICIKSTTPKQQILQKHIEVRTPSPSIISSIVEPDPSKIVDADVLVRLASVYNMCLNSNFVPNIITELYLIFTLLTSSYNSQSNIKVNDNGLKHIKNDVKEPVDPDMNCEPLQQLCLDETVQSLVDPPQKQKLLEKENQPVHGYKNVLTSIHNCVMFAAVVIEKQFHLLPHLDKSVIRLLLENTRFSMFLPHSIPNLTHILETQEASEPQITLSTPSSVLTNRPILYNTETDNKSNFSTDNNFFLFKKQRDCFYEILHEWRTNYTNNSWKSKTFQTKVKYLLDLSSDPVNLMHLARLLCAQLTCSSSEQSNSEFELPGVTKDKLSRLEARFSKPLETVGGPRPLPQFPGEQQFYQQFFLFVAGSPLLAHVVDFLSHELGHLDSTAFFDEGSSTEESKVQVLTCVSNCCLLAKFLGLLVFMPYRSDNPLPPETLQAQVLVRQMVVPPVDLHAYLQRALTNNRLVITVPWVVAYLGMMDSAAPLLSCYRPSLQLLADIYLSFPLPHMYQSSCLLMRCSLGWLFDISFFPENVFLSLFNNDSPNQLLERNCEPADVDVKDVVDQLLLNEVCPFLGSLRLLLAASSGNKRGTFKHIRPVPAHQALATIVTPKQTIEMKLEESFLNSRPPSFRASVEFVVERVASSCIKYICSNVIAYHKEKTLISFNNQTRENQKLNKQEVQLLLVEACQVTLVQIHAAVKDHCIVQAGQALTILLGPDAKDPSVFQSTHNICSRRCQERVINWLNSHIKLQDIFSKILNGSNTKNDEDQITNRKDVEEHKDTAMTPPDLLIELQERMCQCMETRNISISEQQVLDFINSALETVKYRCDLTPYAEQTLFASTVDYCIVLLAQFPNVISVEVLSQLCLLWSACKSPSNCPLQRMLSYRNVLLLCQSSPQLAVESWRQLAHLLVRLLKEELLSPKQLETQFVELFRKEWPPMVHTLIGTCLSCLLEQIQQDLSCNKNSKFVLMLEWANEMMNELGRDDIFEDS